MPHAKQPLSWLKETWNKDNWLLWVLVGIRVWVWVWVWVWGSVLPESGVWSVPLSESELGLGLGLGFDHDDCDGDEKVSTVAMKMMMMMMNFDLKIVGITVANERLSTRVNLDRRGIDLHLVRCLVCDDDLEKEIHIFVHCATVKQTWTDILKCWNLHNLVPFNLFEAITLADQANPTSTLTYLLNNVIQSSIWILWRNRNEITFKNNRSNKDAILNDVKLYSFNWISREGDVFYEEGESDNEGLLVEKAKKPTKMAKKTKASSS
ncbi:RNA-directed DNA polymerase, eukaryota, reverse transcriptase zinc-binding domain protein [Tanacetum coccineum]